MVVISYCHGQSSHPACAHSTGLSGHRRIGLRGNVTQLSCAAALARNVLALRAFSGVSQMDFFERYLGFSGGRGDGTLEAMSLLVLLIIIIGIVMAFFHKRHERD